MAVARLIDRGVRGAALNSAIGARFPGISADARADVIALARNMVSAGRSLTGQPQDLSIDPSIVPTVDPSFRGWEGNVRAKVGVEVSFPGREGSLKLIVGLDDLTTIADLDMAVLNLLETIIDQYEERIEGFGIRSVPKGSQLKISFIQKAF